MGRGVHVQTKSKNSVIPKSLPTRSKQACEEGACIQEHDGKDAPGEGAQNFLVRPTASPPQLDLSQQQI